MCHSELVELLFELDSVREALHRTDVAMIRQAQMETNERTIDNRVRIHRQQKQLRKERIRANMEIGFALECPTMKN